jgi:RNA polymerase sigma factor (sigma-70 family)
VRLLIETGQERNLSVGWDVGSGMVEPVTAHSANDRDSSSRSRAEYHSIFVQHHARLVRFAYLLGCEGSQLEDVVADAFVRTYLPWQSGEVADVGPYLRRAVVNGVRDRARRRETRTRWEARTARERPTDDGHRVGEHERVVSALNTLSDDLRETVVLRYFDDFTEAKTAEVLGIPLGTVKSRTARALEQLRVTLKEHDHD